MKKNDFINAKSLKNLFDNKIYWAISDALPADFYTIPILRGKLISPVEELSGNIPSSDLQFHIQRSLDRCEIS